MSDGLLVELMDASALLGLSPVFALSAIDTHWILKALDSKHFKIN